MEVGHPTGRHGKVRHVLPTFIFHSAVWATLNLSTHIRTNSGLKIPDRKIFILVLKRTLAEIMSG
jgi:hypothetical protein